MLTGVIWRCVCIRVKHAPFPSTAIRNGYSVRKTSTAPAHHQPQTATMTIPIATITSFRTAYNPFSRASRPCRLFLGMLRTPDTIPTSSPTHIDIKVKQLPRNSTESPTMTVGFKGGKELTLDIGKRGLKIGDVIEEVSRVGRALQREASLKN
ncbi:unnamed protein product [Penicillium glandicola]